MKWMLQKATHLDANAMNSVFDGILIAGLLALAVTILAVTA